VHSNLLDQPSLRASIVGSAADSGNNSQEPLLQSSNRIPVIREIILMPFLLVGVISRTSKYARGNSNLAILDARIEPYYQHFCNHNSELVMFQAVFSQGGNPYRTSF
jgi:hypothetical protein